MRRSVFVIGMSIVTLCSCGSLSSESKKEKARDSDEEGTAKGWVSSGGELIDDQKNPWWIQNTKEIRYCILSDEKDFSASQTEINDSFRSAFSYWQKDFAAMGSDFAPLSIQVASQELTQVNCENQQDSNVDLYILAGEAKLTKQQISWLGNKLEKIVGIAVRTSYDRVNLQGKGFIYLRGDREKSHLPWKSPKMLSRLLIHELGHVFGIDHRKNSVMEEDAPAQWFETDYSAYDYAKVENLPPMFSYTEGLHQCTVSVIAGYFAHENHDESNFDQEYFPCLELTKGDSNYSSWNVFVGKDKDSMSYVGKIVSERASAVWRASDANFYLPPEQNVLDETEMFFSAAYQRNLNVSGYAKYIHKDGWVLDSLKINLGPSSVYIDRLMISQDGLIKENSISFIQKTFGDWLF